ncbi:MAG: acyl carrier protein [Candidatus Blackburnbacteria bacterium]|nr:acyl carrier protein [Candidatus Blackburnbacteria bacterium]
MATRELVRSILAEKLGLEIADIEDQSNLEEDLGIDASTMTDILNTIQERAGIELPTEEVRLNQTVEQLINLVEENSLE